MGREKGERKKGESREGKGERRKDEKGERGRETGERYPLSAPSVIDIP